MRGRRRAVVGLTGTGLLAGMAVRRARARKLARRMTGSPPVVRTDDGVRLHVEVDGPADAPLTVVFAHGFAARSAMFDPQWSALHGCARLIRYDQRGHGASGWAGARSATVDRLGRDLGHVVDSLAGNAPVVVVGHSMGGMTVLSLAGQRPELFGSRIAGVALLSTRAAPLPGTGSRTTPPGRIRTALSAAGAWLLWVAAPLVGALRPFRSRPGRRVLRRRLFAGDPPERAASAMSRMWIDTPAGVMAAYLTSLATYDRRAAIETLRTVPVLVIAGTADSTIPASSAQRLAERIGEQARLLLVDGAGHMVNVTHAATVNEALERLLARAHTDTDERSTT